MDNLILRLYYPLIVHIILYEYNEKSICNYHNYFSSIPTPGLQQISVFPGIDATDLFTNFLHCVYITIGTS